MSSGSESEDIIEHEEEEEEEEEENIVEEGVENDEEGDNEGNEAGDVIEDDEEEEEEEDFDDGSGENVDEGDSDAPESEGVIEDEGSGDWSGEGEAETDGESPGEVIKRMSNMGSMQSYGESELPMTYEIFLAPLGVPGEYVEGFENSGIAIEDLSVITSDDLSELVGITDRLHQIMIKAHIKRMFAQSSTGRVRRASSSRSVAKPTKRAKPAQTNVSKGLGYAMKGLNIMGKVSKFVEDLE